MMKRVTSPGLTLVLGFSDKDRTLRLLRSLSLDPRVSVNILKARITEHYAWLQLELIGQGDRLIEVASLLNEAATDKDPDGRPASRAS